MFRRAFRTSPSHDRRWLNRLGPVGLALALVIAPMALLPVTAEAALTTTLANSPFNGSNGALDANSGAPGPDLPTGSNDDSYTGAGGGAHEDTPCPTVETGSIPPEKADLTNLYVATATGGGDTFLYLAWERASTGGTVTLDFELNKSGEVKPVPLCNGLNPTRSAGDKLITYDLQGNKDALTVVISVRTWNTLTNEWGPESLLSSSAAEGSINPNLLFGEMVINLNLAGIFQTGLCENFATVFLKSRSSNSFDSALKDFIAPVSKQVSNCGSLTVTKNVVGGAGDESFGFTVDCGLYDLNGVADGTDSVFSLGDDDVKSFVDLPIGTQCTVRETDPGASSWSTSYTIPGGSAQTGLTTSSIAIALGTKDVLFTNTRRTGTLTVVKDLVPSSDSGLFNLRIDGSTAGTGGNVGDNGTTGSVTLNTGTHTVGETAGTNTLLTDYTSSISCSNQVSAANAGPLTITVLNDQDVVCTITNTRLVGSLTVSKTTNAAGTFTFDVVCTNGLVQVITITTGNSGAETIDGIPTRTSCTVTERDNPLFSSVVIPENGTVVITTQGQTVAFTNTRITGPLTITKTAIGGTGTFTFDVNCSDNAFDQVVTIEGSGSQTITGIPTTTSCTVTERSNSLFTTSVLPLNGTVSIDAGGENVGFVNTAKPNGLTVDKKVNGGDHATTGDALLAHNADALTYTVVVTNNGQVPLTITAMSDSLYPSLVIACPQAVGSVLAAGASFTCTYKVGANGDAHNVVSVSAIDGLERPLTASDGTYVDVINPAIAIVKTATPGSITDSGPVTYSYVVTNIGDAVLHGVVVNDDIIGLIGTIGTLNPGETRTLTRTVDVDFDTPRTNIGTVSGSDVLGGTVTANDKETITVVLGLLLVQPAATPPAVLPLVELPRTGAPLGTEGRVGIILLQAGLLLGYLSRRRRQVGPLAG